MATPLTFSILSQLADGQFHSGQELAQTFDVSRARIWQAVEALRTLGVDVVAVQGRGYKIFDGLELLEQQSILQQCSSDARAQCAELMILGQVDSTNAVLLKGLEQNNIASGTVCLAEYQAQGRGRLGRSWVSPLGGNIYCSLAWCFDQGAAGLMGLSIAIGVAVAKALQAMQVPDIYLKWPNDIFHQDKKIGGILIEIVGDALGPCDVIIGVGLNVRMGLADTQQIEQPFTDLTTATGRQISRNTLAAHLITQIFAHINTFNQSQLTDILPTWQQFDKLKDKQVLISHSEEKLQAQVIGIDHNGQLMIKANGQQQHLTSAHASIEMVE